MEHIYDTPRVVHERGKLIYSMKTKLEAPIDRVWSHISDRDKLLEWDSMLMELDGEIKKGSQIKLRSKLSPNQQFKLKVSEYRPPNQMVWESGFWPMFKGVRSYRLEEQEGGTLLSLEESFSGLMLPLIKKKLPDCETIFGTYVKDLKKQLEVY